jgi:hypothetical protein
MSLKELNEINRKYHYKGPSLEQWINICRLINDRNKAKKAVQQICDVDTTRNDAVCLAKRR